MISEWMMAKQNIKFRSLGHYRGIELICTIVDAKLVFLAWMDKFYQASDPEVLYQLIDAWWMVRRN